MSIYSRRLTAILFQPASRINLCYPPTESVEHKNIATTFPFRPVHTYPDLFEYAFFYPYPIKRYHTSTRGPFSKASLSTSKRIHCDIRHFIFISFHFISFHFISFHFISFHFHFNLFIQGKKHLVDTKRTVLQCALLK